jgi:hypothetical protein
LLMKLCDTISRNAAISSVVKSPRLGMRSTGASLG